MTGDLRLRARGNTPRCVVCRDELPRRADARACASCHAGYHAECLDGLPGARCATLGCAGQVAAARPSVAIRSARSLLGRLPGLLLLFCLSAAALALAIAALSAAFLALARWPGAVMGLALVSLIALDLWVSGRLGPPHRRAPPF